MMRTAAGTRNLGRVITGTADGDALSRARLWLNTHNGACERVAPNAAGRVPHSLSISAWSSVPRAEGWLWSGIAKLNAGADD